MQLLKAFALLITAYGISKCSERITCSDVGDEVQQLGLLHLWQTSTQRFDFLFKRLSMLNLFSECINLIQRNILFSTFSILRPALIKVYLPVHRFSGDGANRQLGNLLFQLFHARLGFFLIHCFPSFSRMDLSLLYPIYPHLFKRV